MTNQGLESLRRLINTYRDSAQQLLKHIDRLQAERKGKPTWERETLDRRINLMWIEYSDLQQNISRMEDYFQDDKK